MRALLPILLLAAGCASVPPPTTIPTTRAPELRPLPADPSTEALPPGTPEGEWVTSIEVGSCYDATGLHGPDAACPPRSGILSSEARAARDGLYRIRYRELRTIVEADRTTWSAQRALYEATIQQAIVREQRLQPMWLERNALPIGLVTGVLLGAGGVAALALAIH